MVAEGLLKFLKVQLVVSISGCQRDVKDRIIALCEVDTGEVVAVKIRVFLKNLVGLSEAWGGDDGRFGVQLENNLLLCD